MYFVDMKRFSLNYDALKHMPSKTLRSFMASDAFNQLKIDKPDLPYWKGNPLWSYMQLATFFFWYAPKRKTVRVLREMAKYDKNEQEKALFRKAAKDLSKYRCKTDLPNAIAFYDKFIYKPGLPAFPFDELLYLPILFKEGDVVKFLRKGKSVYCIAEHIPDYEKDKFIDISDESILLYELNGKENLLDCEKRGYYHTHVHPTMLDVVPDSQIPQQYRDTVLKYREKYCKQEIEV